MLSAAHLVSFQRFSCQGLPYKQIYLNPFIVNEKNIKCDIIKTYAPSKNAYCKVFTTFGLKLSWRPLKYVIYIYYECV